jgi:hypothetical protein
MKTVWSTWEAHIRELYDHMAPRRARWNTSDFNRGSKINSLIINNTPLLAARNFAALFMSSFTNPVSTFFRFTLPDPDMADWPVAKRYLNICEERVRWLLQMGTWYQALSDGVYPDIAIAGFSCALLEEDPEILMRAHCWTIGEYYLAANNRGEVDSAARVVPMTVRQLVSEFIWDGMNFNWERCSPSIRKLWDNAAHDTMVEVTHIIEPNWELEPGKLGPRGMKFTSWYFDAADTREGVWLRQGGYEEFPCLCPRWTVRGGESYGRSEGMNALGDAKQLQHHERRLALLIDKSANPPMVADESMVGHRMTIIPGEVTFTPRHYCSTSSGRNGGSRMQCSRRSPPPSSETNGPRGLRPKRSARWEVKSRCNSARVSCG